jgi:DNA-directed RNA polymerase specialized sigma24 family protein
VALPDEITRLLEDWGEGDRGALERLMPAVYEELRRIARRYMRREGSGHTLQTTELVNEAYLRLAGGSRVRW